MKQILLVVYFNDFKGERNLKNYYEHTTQCIKEYNRIMYKIQYAEVDTTEEEDEFVMNFCIHLAHALIKDTGGGQLARAELCKVADIVKEVCGQ